jgi:hypothetical protein
MQVLSPEVDDSVDIPMGYKEDLQQVHSKINALSQKLTKILAPTPVPVSKWQKAAPLIAAAAFILAAWGRYTDHVAMDVKNQIKLEVGDQLKEPLKQLNEMSGDVKAIKGFLSTEGFRVFISLPKTETQAGLVDLNRTLELAQQAHIAIPAGTLEQVRQKLSGVAGRTPDFWTTVAATINYQSLIDQLNGHAPDPATVSRPCGGFTQGMGGYNFFRGSFIISDCVVDLDSTHNALEGVTFKDSVIRYHGGPVDLSDISFVNCRFVLDIPASAPSNPERNRLLMTLLTSPDTKSVTIPATHS